MTEIKEEGSIIFEVEPKPLASSQPITSRPSKSRGGKIKRLFRINNKLVSLGPDYWIFLPAFSFFVGAAYFMTKTVLNTFEHWLVVGLTLLICILQPLSYLVTALTDPGYVFQNAEEPFESMIEDSNNKQGYTHTKQCKRCNLRVYKTTYHCGECDLCVAEYDHHCPWVSKCIGKHNLKVFNLFLGMTPVFFVFCFIMLFACASQALMETVQTQPVSH